MRFGLILVLLSFACGGPASEDPCAVPAGEVSVSPQSTSEKTPSLSCTGTAGGKTLACSEETRVEKTSCTAGFAFTLTSGNAVLVLRLHAQDGTWKAGARVEGEELSGSLSMQGLYDPTLPAPPAGQVQHASFALHGEGAVLDGGFSVTW